VVIFMFSMTGAASLPIAITKQIMP
jgi:hypothetical protein